MHQSITFALNTKAFRPTCNFTRMIDLCNKKSLHQGHDKPTFIWTWSYWVDLNSAFELVLTSLNYLISIVGIYTNSMVVLVIMGKRTKEMFKDYKHYSYLSLNSIFNIIMLSIQIFSWLVECSKLTWVFCPPTH